MNVYIKEKHYRVLLHIAEMKGVKVPTVVREIIEKVIDSGLLTQLIPKDRRVEV